MIEVLQDLRRELSDEVIVRRANGWGGPGRPSCHGGGTLRLEVIAKRVQELRYAGERDVRGRETPIPGGGARCEAGGEFAAEALCGRDNEHRCTVTVS